MGEQPARKRPFGVTAIIILQILTMVLLANDIFSGKIFYAPSLFFADFFRLVNSNTTAVIAVIALIYLLIVAIGLLRLKRWAWLLIMAQLGLSMAFDLWTYFNGTPNFPRMLINVVIVFYLNQREVQQAFGHKRRPLELT